MEQLVENNSSAGSTGGYLRLAEARNHLVATDINSARRDATAPDYFLNGHQVHSGRFSIVTMKLEK